MDELLEELERFKVYANGYCDRLIHLAKDENYHLMGRHLNNLFSHFRRLQSKIEQEIVTANQRTDNPKVA